jgi:starch phosphorylase
VSEIAYLSMEIAVDPAIPTYSGGLGVLAGDTVRSCADLGMPFVAVTLLHRRGYFRQRLDASGAQTEEAASWRPEDFAEPLESKVELELEGRRVAVGAWRYRVRGASGAEVSVYMLDTDQPENAEADRHITDSLYGGDDRYRLLQEAVLGIGGVRMLRKLGHRQLMRLHLNEGHAALAVVELLEESGQRPGDPGVDSAALVAAVRRRCVFTTHTPVPAGHDRFPMELVERVVGPAACAWLRALGQGELVNLTDVALRGSRFVNGVAMRHGEVSRGMFPQYPVRSITNGIHPPTWAWPSVRALFDRHIPDWRRDALALRYAVGIPLSEIWWAHSRAKRALVDHVNRTTDARFDAQTLTFGFARRATGYKRAALVFSDLERLAQIARHVGPLQFVFAGKAHPRDADGKAMIARIFAAAAALRGRVAVAYLPDYDMDLGKLLVAGADVWLNNPMPPLEASGTSGMKAALNGVPSLSVLDGWWVEGCVEGVTGWAIGRDGAPVARSAADLEREHVEALYAKLERAVLPLYYKERERFQEMMRWCIALNASFFNTQRMVLEYLYEAYVDDVR